MGKQDDIFRTQIRIPSDIYEAIKISSEESGRSINAEMIYLMSTALGIKPDAEPLDAKIREIVREELAKASKG